jgi:hypothetical protein
MQGWLNHFSLELISSRFKFYYRHIGTKAFSIVLETDSKLSMVAELAKVEAGKPKYEWPYPKVPSPPSSVHPYYHLHFSE